MNKLLMLVIFFISFSVYGSDFTSIQKVNDTIELRGTVESNVIYHIEVVTNINTTIWTPIIAFPSFDTNMFHSISIGSYPILDNRALFIRIFEVFRIPPIEFFWIITK